MKSRLINFRGLFYFFLVFLLGIIVARRFYNGAVDVIIVSLLVLGVFAGYLIYRKSYIPLIFIFVFFFLGNGFYFIGESTYNVKDYSGKVAVVGRVSDDISFSSFSGEIVLDNVKINGKSAQNVRLTIENCPENIQVGDYIAFESEVEKSKPYYILQFNAKDYRAGVRYTSTVDYDDVVFSNGFTKADESVRKAIKTAIYQNMSEDNASIAYAVMFGDKSDLDGDIHTAYQQSGIIHVLTVSGLHVGFLVGLFYGLLKKCRVNKIANLCISTVVVVFYAYLCNFSPSVVRAGIMSVCYMFSRAVNRKYDSLCALGLAGFVLCLIKPLTALDTGFLMSFFCVYGIIMLNNTLSKFFAVFMPEKIASLISLSTSAQLGILPFTALMGGTINLLSFVVNLIVVPIFSIIYPYLFVISMIGTFIPWGILLKAVDFVFLIINKLAIFFGSAGLVVPLSEMGFGLVVVFFVLLFIFGRYFMLNNVKKLASFACAFISMVLVLGFYSLPINSNSQTSISYLNSYGQMSVILTTKSGQTAVVGENTLLERYQNKYDLKNYDLFLSYKQLKDEKVSQLAELGFYKFITVASEVDQNSNCEVAKENYFYTIGNLKFNYLTFYDKDFDREILIGIMFDVDNHKIFVAKNCDLSYNNYEYILSQHQPEIVVAGDNVQLGQGSNYICLSYKDIEGCEYSYSKQGNFKLSFQNKKWNLKTLD